MSKPNLAKIETNVDAVLESFEKCETGNCDGCAFEYMRRVLPAMCAYYQQRSARYLLKKLAEQTPRVLTLEEVEALPYGYVLIETDKKDSLHWVDALLFCKNTNFSFDFITLEGRARLLGSTYNMEWRCWTSRPTEEQLKGVEWTCG